MFIQCSHVYYIEMRYIKTEFIERYLYVFKEISLITSTCATSQNESLCFTNKPHYAVLLSCI